MNVRAIKKNFKGLDVGIKVFFTLVLASRPDGTVDLSKTRISECLNVSRQTVGRHIKTFADCGILKYKFSGKGMFNPDFYYVGPPEQKQRAQEDYARFKSDT